MGPAIEYVLFDNRAPSITDIADKVAAISGLAVAVTSIDNEDVFENRSNFHGYIAFECNPSAQTTLTVSNTGTDGQKNRHSVHIQSASEPTLFSLTLLALEALGGQPSRLLDEEYRRKYGQTVTKAQLEYRHWKLMADVVYVIFVVAKEIPKWIFLAPLRLWRSRKKFNSQLDQFNEALQLETDSPKIGRTDLLMATVQSIPAFLFLYGLLLAWAICMPFYFVGLSAKLLYKKLVSALLP